MRSVFTLAFLVAATSALAGTDCTTIGPQTHCYGSGGSYTTIFTTPGRTQVMSSDSAGNMDTSNIVDFSHPDQPQPGVVIPIE